MHASSTDGKRLATGRAVMTGRRVLQQRIGLQERWKQAVALTLYQREGSLDLEEEEEAHAAVAVLMTIAADLGWSIGSKPVIP